MSHRKLSLVIFPVLLLASCRSAPQAPFSLAMKTPHRILFVGNSFTFYNGGLQGHFKKLSESAHPPRLLIADQATKGGATLKILQGQESIHRKIREGHYDLVVLQEDIPELIEHDVAPFLEQVRLFDREIRGAGGNTALFMAWPYERLNWVGLAVIAEAHLAIGKELNVPVAPVGLAFQQSLQARPGLAMLGKDREHETIHGTYLAANVIYATIFLVSPLGLSYHPQGVSAEEAAFLQGIAWSAVKDWKKLQ
ncbi:MAG: hypothetical protein EXS02_11075 [Planctomycetes bacterium]|nr:hypothetical protein [Planctomycetota bacterium]